MHPHEVITSRLFHGFAGQRMQGDLHAQAVHRNNVHDAALKQIAMSSSGSSAHMEQISQAVVMTQQTAPIQG